MPKKKKQGTRNENENEPSRKKAACCHCYYLVITYYFYDHRLLSSSFGFLSGEQVKLMKKNVSPTFCPARPQNPPTNQHRVLCPFRSALLILLWPLLRLYGFWGFCFIALGKCHKDNNGTRRRRAGVENLNKMWQMVFYLINWLNRLSGKGIAFSVSPFLRTALTFMAVIE